MSHDPIHINRLENANSSIERKADQWLSKSSEGKKGQAKGHKEYSGVDVNILYADCGGSFTGVGVHLSKHIELYVFNGCHFWYISYTQ